MKLIIQIPAYNEEAFIGHTLQCLPRILYGIDYIDIVVIDDYSTDNTVSVARENSARVISNTYSKGLAGAFQSGLDEAKSAGTDILVNLDADNQYPAAFIQQLIHPILERKCDIAVGDRNINSNSNYSFQKKIFHFLGSRMINIFTRTRINDCVCGFRAYSKKAINSIRISNQFSHTVDTILQAKSKELKLTNCSIPVNLHNRKSRLYTSNFQFIFRHFGVLLNYLLRKQRSIQPETPHRSAY